MPPGDSVIARLDCTCSGIRVIIVSPTVFVSSTLQYSGINIGPVHKKDYLDRYTLYMLWYKSYNLSPTVLFLPHCSTAVSTSGRSITRTILDRYTLYMLWYKSYNLSPTVLFLPHCSTAVSTSGRSITRTILDRYTLYMLWYKSYNRISYSVCFFHIAVQRNQHRAGS